MEMPVSEEGEMNLHLIEFIMICEWAPIVNAYRAISHGGIRPLKGTPISHPL
jgi:hypothetical protein